MLVLTVSFLMLPFTTTWVTNENTKAYESPTEIMNYTAEAFTEKFTGTIPAKAFVGPDNAFDVVNASIHAATTTFYLEVYTLSSQNLIDSLIYAKVINGVDVIVLLEFDHVSGDEDDYNEQSSYLLDDAGIEVLWTTPDYDFTHAKFWVVDSEYTYVYSGNWAPSSLPADTDARTNREMGLMFESLEIAEKYEDIFFEDYAKATAYSGINPSNILPSESSGTYEPVKPNPLTITEYMEVIPIFSPNNSYSMLLSLIENATTTIDVQQQYLTNTCELTYDLIDAANRGIEIRVMFPKPNTASKNVTEILLQNGIDVRFSYSLYNHNKFILVDGEYVSVSSINWSNGSVVDNREAGAIVKNTNIADYFADVFENDWENLTNIPTGFSGDVNILAPLDKEILDGNFLVEAEFLLENYTKGEIKIDGVVKHTWTDPSGEESHSMDTTTIANGIHTMTVVGTTDDVEEISDEVEFQVINVDDWLMLISEVKYDGVSGTDSEFIELYNDFAFDVDISGWEIYDGESSWFFPDGTIFDSKDILILVRDTATFNSEMTALGVDYYPPDFEYSGPQLGNDGDEVMFLDADAVLRDACVWGDGTLSGHTSWSGTMTDDLSLQRDPANMDTDDCSVDFVADTPAPGYVTIELTTFPWPGFLIVGTIFAISITSVLIRKYSKK
ncbi:MAG: phospholipase D-like domain-containing protein [Candidatus Heimdallarchaeota archaeon]